MTDNQIQNATILIAEDDPAILGGVSDLLKIANTGYEIKTIEAPNGAAALAMMGHTTPDLVISDISMPEMDGFEFFDSVRENKEWAIIPFIFLTAKVTEQDQLAGRYKGAERYITKPFQSIELVKHVTTLLEKKFTKEEINAEHIKHTLIDITRSFSHELRTPIGLLIGFVDVLFEVDNPSYNGGNLALLVDVDAAVQRLSKLIQSFMSGLSAHNGTMRADILKNVETIDSLSDLLKACCAEATANSASTITIVQNIPESLPPISGFHPYLEMAFNELLENAVKFCLIQQDRVGAKASQITVSARVENDVIKIQFDDEGFGFDPNHDEKIFDLFHQYGRFVDDIKLEQQGAGIGLYIVKEIIVSHNGTIKASNLEPNGASLSIELPVFNPDKSPTVQDDPLEKSRVKILVVEDNEAIRVGMEEQLTYSDSRYVFEVETAEHGVEGLYKLSESVPDLIISDILMPEMNGYDFRESIKDNPALGSIPFIFLTALGERSEIFKGQILGADEYITKPYKFDKLLNLIEARLARHFDSENVALNQLEHLREQILTATLSSFVALLDNIKSSSAELGMNLKENRPADENPAILARLRGHCDEIFLLNKRVLQLVQLRTQLNDHSVFQERAELIDELPTCISMECQQWLRKDSHSAILLDNFVSEIPEKLPTVHGISILIQDAVRFLLDGVAGMISAESTPPSPSPQISLVATEVVNGVEIVVEANPIDNHALLQSVIDYMSEENESSTEESSDKDDTQEQSLGESESFFANVREIVSIHGGTCNFSAPTDTSIRAAIIFNTA